VVVRDGQAAVEVTAVLKVHGGGADGDEAAACLGLAADKFEKLIRDPAALKFRMVVTMGEYWILFFMCIVPTWIG
jgi:hypothetical protein